jgi:hypothetical protein
MQRITGCDAFESSYSTYFHYLQMNTSIINALAYCTATGRLVIFISSKANG